MSNEKVIRAWKDADFRGGLSDAERALLPENPAGAMDLSAAELDAVVGGLPPTATTWTTDTCGCK